MANVIYGNWVDMSTPAFWSKSGIGFTVSYAAPPITQELLDRGMILVYSRQNGKVVLLPSAFIFSYIWTKP